MWILSLSQWLVILLMTSVGELFLFRNGKDLYLTSVSECNRILTIPSVSYQDSQDGYFNLEDVKSIVVDSRFATSVDRDGHSLIPPTLEEFARIFCEDLRPILNRKPRFEYGARPRKGSIFITVDKNREKYLDAAKRYTSEGYSIETNKDSVLVKGASPLGAWWGTRTILQAMALEGHLPYGHITDSPGWVDRGVMVGNMISCLIIVFYNCYDR